nr:FxLYD domain-containing protein [uncultured Desulfuromonas sp.]
MNETKECIMCFSKINARAKKCPYCRSLQSKYTNLESSPIFIGLISVLIVVVFTYVYFEAVHLSLFKSEPYKDLEVSVNDVSEKLEGNTLYVACLGRIKNIHEARFANLQFEANFYDAQNTLIDTIVFRDQMISVPPNDEVSFRVRGVGQKSLGDYSSCQVKIRDAWVK